MIVGHARIDLNPPHRRLVLHCGRYDYNDVASSSAFMDSMHYCQRRTMSDIHFHPVPISVHDQAHVVLVHKVGGWRFLKVPVSMSYHTFSNTLVYHTYEHLTRIRTSRVSSPAEATPCPNRYSKVTSFRSLTSKWAVMGVGAVDG